MDFSKPPPNWSSQKPKKLVPNLSETHSFARPKEWTNWLKHVAFFKQALSLSDVTCEQAQDGRLYVQFSIDNVTFSGLLDTCPFSTHVTQQKLSPQVSPPPTTIPKV